MTKTKRPLSESLYWAYLGLNIVLLAFFMAFVRYKTTGLYMASWLSLPCIAAFCLLGGLIIFLVRGSKRLSLWRIALVLLLWIALLFAYDYSAVEAWVDSKADVETAHRLQQIGLTGFLRDYHQQTASEILNSSSMQEKMDRYDRLLPFYPVRERLEAQAQDYSLLEDNHTGHPFGSPEDSHPGHDLGFGLEHDRTAHDFVFLEDHNTGHNFTSIEYIRTGPDPGFGLAKNPTVHDFPSPEDKRAGHRFDTPADNRTSHDYVSLANNHTEHDLAFIGDKTTEHYFTSLEDKHLGHHFDTFLDNRTGHDYASLANNHTAHDLAFPEDKPTVQHFTSSEDNRTAHHSPLYFMILALWMELSSSVLTLKVFAKALYLIFLLSIFFLLRYLLKKRDLAFKTTLIVGFMPALLFASQAPKNDLLLGIVSAWIMLMLCRFTRAHQIHHKTPIWQHFAIGLLLLLAILSKFTALLIILPILAIYLFIYRWQAWKPLLALALPILIIPILLYLIFGYDLLLNIVTGRIIQDQWIAEHSTPFNFLFQRLPFAQFRVGLPLMLIIPFAFLSMFIPKIPYINNRFSSFWQSNVKKEPSSKKSHSPFPISHSPTETNSTSESHSPFSILNSQLEPHSPFSILHFQLITLIFYLSIYLILWGSSVDRHQIGFLPFALPFISQYLFRSPNPTSYILNSTLPNHPSPFTVPHDKSPANYTSSDNSQFSILNSQLIMTLLLIYNLLFISYSLSDNHLEAEHLIPFETTSIIP